MDGWNKDVVLNENKANESSFYLPSYIYPREEQREQHTHAHTHTYRERERERESNSIQKEYILSKYS